MFAYTFMYLLYYNGHFVDCWQSGLSYTIIHPGGLNDATANIEQLVLDVDDKFMSMKHRSISRADVTNLCLAALSVGKDKKISFDCITKAVEAGTIPSSATEVLTNFLKEMKTTNYAS